MNNTWGPPTSPDPPRRRTEYGYLVLGSTALASAIVLCAVDHLADADFSRGLYSILTGLFVLGGGGWVVRSGDSQRSRNLVAGLNELRGDLAASANDVAKLTARVEGLAAAVAQSRMTYRPPGPPRVDLGHRYVSTTAATALQNDTVPVNPVVDPATADALRRVNIRLLHGGADHS